MLGSKNIYSCVVKCISHMLLHCMNVECLIIEYGVSQIEQNKMRRKNTDENNNKRETCTYKNI